MQKTTVNPHPEQEMTVNPFAQEQAAEIQPQENAQTYPVEVDGDIVELTLEELIDAAAQGLSKRNAYIRRNRAANAMPNGQIYAACGKLGAVQTERLCAPQPRCERYAQRADLCGVRGGISRCPSRGHPAAGMGVGAAGRLARVRVPQVGDCRTEGRTGSTRDEPEEPPCGGRSGAVGRGTHGGRPGYARFARQVTFAELKMENGKWKITAFILHYQLSIFHYCTIEHLYRR